MPVSSVDVRHLIYIIIIGWSCRSVNWGNSKLTAQLTAPKFHMQIRMRLRRTWAGSNVDRVHHLEENWNFKTKFRTLQLAPANGWKVARPQWQCCGSSPILLQCCFSRSAACIMYSLPQAETKADVWCWLWMLGSDCCRTVAMSVCQSDSHSVRLQQRNYNKKPHWNVFGLQPQR